VLWPNYPTDFVAKLCNGLNMNKRNFVLLGVLLLIATACDSDIPSHYAVLEGDVPFVAEPRTGHCRFPYGSQIALLDAEDGSVLRTQEVPWAGFLRQTGAGFVVEHFTDNQPSGVAAFDDSLNMAYQSEFPGKLRVHADDGGIIPMPGNRLLLRGGKSNKKTSLVLIDASTGEAIWEIVTPSLFTSPVLAGGTVIASTFEDEVLGIDLETGEELWRTTVTSSLRGVAAVRDSVAYLPGVGRVALIDGTGASVGQWPVVGEVASVKLIDPSIALVETRVDGPRKLVALDSESGTALWSVWLNNNPSLGTVPIRTDNQQAVFAGLKESLRSVDLATGQRNWQAVEPDGYRTGLAIEGDSAYVAVRRGSNSSFSYHLTAIDPVSDEVVAWEVDLPGRARLEPTVIGPSVVIGGYPPVSGSRNVLADDQGWLHAYDRRTGDLLWQTTLRESPTHIAQGSNGYVVLTADPAVGCD